LKGLPLQEDGQNLTVGYHAGLLSRLFCRLFLARLQSAFDSKKLRPFSALERFRDRHDVLNYLHPLTKSEWIVDAKPPFAGPEKVLDYVGRYTHRVAISNNRLLDIEDGQVSFRYKDYKDRSQQKTMSLSRRNSSVASSSMFCRADFIVSAPSASSAIAIFTLLRLPLPVKKLLLSQRLHRIQTGRAVSRHAARRNSHQDKQGCG
jgi:Putative transposase